MNFALMLAAAAYAGHADAVLEVDNDFEGELTIYVDGRYEGTARGDARTRVEVKPGKRDVVLQRPGGAVLASRTLHFHKGITAVLPIAAPKAPLMVRNTSAVPLQVDVGPGDGVWISPNTAVELVVTAGTVDLEARVREAGHIERVTVRTLWVEPGQRAETVLDYRPVAHTRLSVRNQGHERLRAVVDGVEVGFVDPGERRSVAVSPGRVTVRFYDRHGRLVEVRDVHADKGQKTAVVASVVPPPPPSPQRPSGSCSGGSTRVALR